MNIAAVSEIELGSHRAHAINVVKTAGGFARLGHTVTLLCRPPADRRPTADHLRDYGEPALSVITASATTSDPHSFGLWAAHTALSLRADALYARQFTAPALAAALHIPAILETHAHINAVNPLLDAALLATHNNPPIAVATINRRLRDHFISRGGHPARIHLIPDGVDTDHFSPRPAPNPFTTPGPNLLYCGHLYDYKGIPTILAAAQRRPDLRFHLVGGAPEDLARVRAAAAALPNLTLHGHVPHAHVPPFLWHADVLLLPPSANDPSAAWTSPVKLGEYLASLRPIVATRIPGLADWIDEPAVTWAQPDDPADLLRAADQCLNEPPAARGERTAAACRKAEEFSYQNRARRLLAAALETLTPASTPIHERAA